ncbi:DUF4276 family protein [Sorangium sp. So ce233]|uniref:DUF4276 family protein n=1 Tax=Sorangium sp. So ce233 TaxID=3133290 RepID=UPI003F615F65
MKGYILVEGEGELGAAENLVTRLWHEAGHWQPWARAITCKSTHQRRGIERGIGLVRAKRDAGALLILRDEDDACPRERGPQMASWARELDPPFPVAVVLMHREYEVLFLPCIELMAGRPLVGPDGQERPGLLPGRAGSTATAGSGCATSRGGSPTTSRRGASTNPRSISGP